MGKAHQAIYAAANLANRYPKRIELDRIDLEEDDLDKRKLQKLVVDRILKGLARTGNELENVMAFIKRAQHSLAAGTNPKLRTRAEKKLVPKEPKDLVYRLLLGEKTRKG